MRSTHKTMHMWSALTCFCSSLNLCLSTLSAALTSFLKPLDLVFLVDAELEPRSFSNLWMLPLLLDCFATWKGNKEHNKQLFFSSWNRHEQNCTVCLYPYPSERYTHWSCSHCSHYVTTHTQQQWKNMQCGKLAICFTSFFASISSSSSSLSLLLMKHSCRFIWLWSLE